MHRDNLNKLADYLLALPPDYDDFDMGTFCRIPGTEVEYLPQDSVHSCGTVACALGHGPRAGIKPELDEGWRGYCLRQFGLRWWSEEAEWCFSGEWALVDDTPRGAGLRIKWLLDGKPIPDEDELTAITCGPDPLPEKFNYLA
ncbi:hypothetical protein [Sphingopyxis flava]|uniref:Uncharacterized protein n=1 Tax=Sphingopyxis flava TaxID=1507287 RepID=A0A1T5CUQ4_9SPHN|nr:hypothetical protein [Sphingopyxis flava]SKB62920.1 hypothetical protein SAMN06295937_1011115 [Sphingopyxis flava]